MGGSPVPAQDPQPQKQRPAYLRPLGPPGPDQAPLFKVGPDPDHSSDRSEDHDRSVNRRSFIPRSITPPGISPSDARLANWLETYAVLLTPKDQPVHPVVAYAGQPAFSAARTFVLRYGRGQILAGLHDLIAWHPDRLTGHWVRVWKPAIVSPARRLYALVRDNDALSRNQAEDRKP